MSERIPRLRPTGDPVALPLPSGMETASAQSGAEDRALQEAVHYVLGDCFFAVGQTIGMRMTVDYDAVVWWHDHFRRSSWPRCVVRETGGFRIGKT